MTDHAQEWTREEATEALRGLMEKWASPPPELISTLPKGGTQLSYLGHADTTRALNEADPTWTWCPMATDEQGLPVLDRDEHGRPVGMWIWLQVCGVERPGYGSVEPGKRDAVKELVGDSIRNAAMRAGIALDLWSAAARAADAAEAAKPQRRRAAKARSNTDLPAADPTPAPGTAELKALHLAAGPDVSMAMVATMLKAEGITDRAALTDPATFERARGLVATAFPAENTQNAGKS
jgi:hypothetical protein